MHPTTAITIIATLTVIALALLIKGLRGKIISTDPHCKKCKYNISNLNTQVNKATNCPECGHDITNPNSTQPYLRTKQKRYITAAILFTLLIITPFTTGSIININFNPYKPFTWLNQELHYNTNNTKYLAKLELFSRIQKNKITNKQAMHYFNIIKQYGNETYQTKNPMRTPEAHYEIFYYLAENNLYTKQQINQNILPTLLKHQTNYARSWHPALGNTILLFHQKNLIPQKSWLKFLENSIEHTTYISTRPRISQDQKSTTYKLNINQAKAFNTKSGLVSFIKTNSLNPLSHPTIEYHEQTLSHKINDKPVHFNTKSQSNDTPKNYEGYNLHLKKPITFNIHQTQS